MSADLLPEHPPRLGALGLPVLCGMGAVLTTATTSELASGAGFRFEDRGTHALKGIAGHHAVGVRTVIKHFPGQGSAGGDTHLGVVDVTRNWTDYELLPFTSLLGQGVVDAVMTGHVFNATLDPTYPATLSYATITGLLREQLGYGGVVISDDLNLGAIRSAVRYEDALALAIGAGVDILMIADPASSDLVARTIDVIAAHVANGALSEARIDASYDRIAALKSLLPGA